MPSLMQVIARNRQRRASAAGKPLIEPRSKKPRKAEDDEDELDEDELENDEEYAGKPGKNKPVRDNAGSAVVTFNARVTVLMQDRKMKRGQAIAAIARHQPELHKAWLLALHATNQAREVKAYRDNCARRLGSIARKNESSGHDARRR